ncbi:MAG: hypothetical protein RID23_16345 [Roseovarius sp.]
MKTETTKNPPTSTKRIMCVADLPSYRDMAQYSVQNEDGQEAVYTLSKRQRQVMDLLLAGPVYCASPVRLSDVVHILKREIDIEVETRFYPGDKETGSGDYGVYFLTSKVRPVEPSEVAA